MPFHLSDPILFHSWPHWSPLRPYSPLRDSVPARPSARRPLPNLLEFGPFSRHPLCMSPPLRGHWCWAVSKEGKGHTYFAPQGLPQS